MGSQPAAAPRARALEYDAARGVRASSAQHDQHEDHAGDDEADAAAQRVLLEEVERVEEVEVEAEAIKQRWAHGRREVGELVGRIARKAHLQNAVQAQ